MLYRENNPMSDLPYSIDKNTMVNHPPHYTQGTIEVIEVIEDWKLPYHLGNAVKYIGRAGHKDNEKQDISKAIWYLERYRDSIT